MTLSFSTRTRCQATLAALVLRTAVVSAAAPETLPLPVTLIVNGEVLERVEDWDRRSNPLMGRPDWLKAIRFSVRVESVIRGEVRDPASPLKVTVTGQTRVGAFRLLTEGWRGEMRLSASADGWELVDVANGVVPPPKPRVVIQPPPPRVAPEPPYPENLSARLLRSSTAMQDGAVRAIAKRYGMKDAGIVFLVSHSGPMPPPGGYVYWGVKGRIRGRWHIWQPGHGKPFPGTKLEDPLRHQK